MDLFHSIINSNTHVLKMKMSYNFVKPITIFDLGTKNNIKGEFLHWPISNIGLLHFFLKTDI